MNFLAHYTVGTHPLSPPYTLGCILPDLVRNFRKGARLKPLACAPGNELDLGVAHHFEADKLFHASPFFVGTSARLRDMLHNSGYRDRRYRFFSAHVGLELLLDRRLIIQDVGVLDRFYFNLGRITVNELRNAFEVYALPDPEGFMRFLGRFRTSRYLYHYQRLGGLIFAWNRIHERVGLPPFDNQATDLLVKMDATLQSTGLSIIPDIASELRNP